MARLSSTRVLRGGVGASVCATAAPAMSRDPAIMKAATTAAPARCARRPKKRPPLWSSSTATMSANRSTNAMASSCGFTGIPLGRQICRRGLQRLKEERGWLGRLEPSERRGCAVDPARSREADERIPRRAQGPRCNERGNPDVRCSALGHRTQVVEKDLYGTLFLQHVEQVATRACPVPWLSRPPARKPWPHPSQACPFLSRLEA